MHTIDYVRKVQACAGFLVILMPLTGCASGKISFLNPVDDSITDTDYNTIFSRIDYHPYSVDYKSWRNYYISMKMFYIDKKYTQYVHDIAHEDTFIGVFGDITQLGLTAAATAIPVTQTTKVLAAAATAVGAAKAVYNKDVLLAQTLQIIETQMRTDRASVKQTIIARFVCDPSQYPIGLALSDLDAYADAGTITSALVSVNKSVSSAQPAKSTSTGTATPESTNVSTSGAPKRKMDVPGGTVEFFEKKPKPCPLS